MHDGSGRITVQQLTKRFGPVTAVQNLSFTVEPGSVTGFLGPNGAGKTTTLRMILGLVRPSVGIATVNGTAFNTLGDPARVVGAVLEAQNFHPKRKARNHLRVYAAAIGVPDTRVEQVLQLVGLGEVGERKAGQFSMGMKQRLALATALLGDPQVLLLDEPANGLDPEGIAWLRTFLQSFARSGRTVLVSSHILAEVEQTVDQLIIISRGQTMYNGPLEHLRRSQQARVLVRPSDPEKLMTALRDAGIYNLEPTPDGRLAVVGVQSEQVADIALKAGVSVYGIEEERVNLEQLYFSLTQGQYTPGTVPQQFGPGQQPYLPPQPPYQVQQPYQPQQYQPQYQQQPYQPPQDQYQPPPQYQPQPGYPPQGYPQQNTPPQGMPPQGAPPQNTPAQHTPAQPTPPQGNPVPDAPPPQFSPWQQQVPPQDGQQPGQADPAQHDQGGLGGRS
ncbi:MAG TPA: ATP-binding cassette domain-containing protein [Pseudonocardiaceae bacterium]